MDFPSARCLLLGWLGVSVGALAQGVQPSAQSATTTPGVTVGHGAHKPDAVKAPTKDDLLRGAYGPYRANNDLLFYKLDLKVDPEAKSIAGSNTIRFRMLEDGTRIQLELAEPMQVDGIFLRVPSGVKAPLSREAVDGWAEVRPLQDRGVVSPAKSQGFVTSTHGQAEARSLQRDEAPKATSDVEDKLTTLKYTREERTVWVDFPETLRKGQVYEVVFAYSGKPVTQGRFGCFSFDKDKEGKPWITTACEGEGASVWWPNKDQWRDKPQDGMEIDVAVPNGLMDVSNGRFVGSKDLGDGTTRWTWLVHYPISNYDVALNIGEYQHFGGTHGETTLDYYALPEDLEKAKMQFAQVPTMLDAYEHYFGEYPFDKDGYKLIEVPYAGMEHQSAVAYGNHFENGYYGRDWTGVGISPKFDFIIIHESGHEWFGNAVTAADVSDMWIHEGWTTYMEALYVEYRWGKADALRYVNGLKPKVHNQLPIVSAHGVNAEPPEDQYFKGALMISTLRSVVNDDAKWFTDLHDFYQEFQYRDIMTEDVVAWWNKRTGMDLTAFFDEYLRHAKLPVLEITYSPKDKSMTCAWKADELDFAMPIEVGDPTHWTTVQPSRGESVKVTWDGAPGDFKVATDLYYVDVERKMAE